MTRKSKKKARTRARMARRGISYTAAARQPETPGSISPAAEPSPRTVLVVADRQFGFDGEVYNLQCVAATKRGTRCANPIEVHGQVAKWDVQGRYRVDWEADSPYWIEKYGSAERLFALYTRQRCKLHVDTDGPNAVTVEVCDIGPLTRTPEDVFDAIQRRVNSGMMTLLRGGKQEITDPDLIEPLSAARDGDMSALLALVAERPLTADRHMFPTEDPDPNFVHTPTWWGLLTARHDNDLTDQQLAQCVVAGAPDLARELELT